MYGVDPNACVARWCVAEMERRYKLMSAVGVRNLAGFNKKVRDAIEAGQPMMDPLFKPNPELDEAPRQLETLPFIVIFIDEFADMMMIVGISGLRPGTSRHPARPCSRSRRR